MVLLATAYDESRFLKAEDLPVERKFRIRECTEEEVGAGKDKERKLVVWFTNDKRGLVLNKTNNRTIRGAYGNDTAGWDNKIIIVFPTMAELRGKMVPALRVRIPPPKQPTAATPLPQPTPSGNGAAAAASAPKAAPPMDDPELADEPPKPLHEELDDEIPFK